MQRNVWNDIASWETRRLTTSQSINSMHLMTIISKKKNWNPGEKCQSILSNCSEMFSLGTYWKTCYSLVSEQTCTISFTHEITSNYCHEGNTAKQSRLEMFRDSDFCRRSWGFKIYVRWNTVHFWKSYVCSNQLDVSETNFSFEQFNRIRNHFFRWRIKVGWFPRTWLVRSDCSSPWKHNSEPCRTVRPVVCLDTNHVRHQSRGVINVLDHVDFVLQTSDFRLYVFEDNEAVIKMIIKGRSPTMRHVSRTHRVALDWLFDRIKLDP